MKIHKYTIGGMMHAVFGAGLIVASSSLYANDKTVAIRVSPFDLLVPAISVRADIKIMENLSVGPMATYWSFYTEAEDKQSTLGYGVRVNWHFNGALENGVYISPSYTRYTIRLETLDGDIGSQSFNTVAAIVGWQWVWDTVNLNLEGGYRVGAAGDLKVKNAAGDVIDTISGAETNVAEWVLDFTVGFAF